MRIFPGNSAHCTGGETLSTKEGKQGGEKRGRWFTSVDAALREAGRGDGPVG